MSALSASLRNPPQRMWMPAEKPAGNPASSASISLVRSTPVPDVAEPGALLICCSEGVQIVRDGQVVPAVVGRELKLGDRVTVPAGGSAQAVFQEQDGQAVLGNFDGGSDAVLVYFSKKNGACSVVFDVFAGQVELSLSAIAASRLDGKARGGEERRAVGFHCYSRPSAGR